MPEATDPRVEPEDDDSTPEDDDSTPEDDDSTPEDDDSTPEDDDSTPEDDESTRVNINAGWYEIVTEIDAVVFDAYGTLLDVHAAMARHARQLGPNWQRISADWRQKQLEYSWVRSLAGPPHHRDFWRLTEEALAWTAAHHGISDRAVLADVLAAYRALDAYPEAPAVLRRIRASGARTAILSNGEPGMLADATRSAGLDQLLDHILSIETVGVFKPDPRVYRLAENALDLPAARMAFVSSNPWDAFGARSFGFRVFWINRSGLPPEYELPEVATELPDLTALPDAIGAAA